MTTFRDRIVQFLARTDLPPSALGRSALQDPPFVADFMSGRRSPRLDTVERVDRWMDNYEASGAAIANDAAPLTMPTALPYGARSIRFELKAPTPVLNQTRRLHFQAYKRQRQTLAWEIKLATVGRGFSAPLRYAHVTIERRSIGRPDRDGVWGGAKALIDCLMPVSDRHPSGLGFIADDNPDCTLLEVNPVRVMTKAEQGTIVTIRELEHAPSAAAA